MQKRVAKLIGGAGTGKTRTMMEVIEVAKDRLGGSPFAVEQAKSLSRFLRVVTTPPASARRPTGAPRQTDPSAKNRLNRPHWWTDIVMMK